MALLTLIGLSIASTFVPGASEGLAFLYVEKLHWHPLTVAATCALGQSIDYSALFLFGELLLVHWRWLDGYVGRIRQRYEAHLEERFLAVSILSGTIGTPPATAMAALGPSFRVPFVHLLPTLFLGRVLRFLVVIEFGHRLAAWAHLHGLG